MCSDTNWSAIGIGRRSYKDAERSDQQPRTWHHGIPMDRRTCSCRACEGHRCRRADKVQRHMHSAPESHRVKRKIQVGTSTRNSAPRWSTSSPCRFHHSDNEVRVQCSKDWQIGNIHPHTELGNCNTIRREDSRHKMLHFCTDSASKRQILGQVEKRRQQEWPATRSVIHGRSPFFLLSFAWLKPGREVREKMPRDDTHTQIAAIENVRRNLSFELPCSGQVFKKKKETALTKKLTTRP